MSEWRLRKRPPRKPYYVEFWHAGSYRRYSCKTENKPLALKIARKLYDETLAGHFDVAPRGRRTLEELFDLYVRDCEMRVEGRKGKRLQGASVGRARCAIRNVLDGLSVTWPDQVTEQKLAEYQSRRLSGEDRKRQNSGPRRASAFTYNTEARHLQAFLNWCKRERFIRNVPPIPKAQTDTKGKTVILTEAEVGPFLSNLPPHEAWAAFLLLNTGLRLQEMRFLEWTDVDLEVGLLRIRRKPELDFSPKKGKERDVPIVPDLADALMERRKATGWVCPGPRNKQIHEWTFSHALKRAAKQAGIPKNVTAHTLRHTFGSLAVLQGMPLKVLADVMGHSTIAITEIYVHTEAEQRIAAMAKFRVAGMAKGQKVIPMPTEGKAK